MAELRACSPDAVSEAFRLGYDLVALDHAVDAETLSRKSEYSEQRERIMSLRRKTPSRKLFSRITISLGGPRVDFPKTVLDFDIVAVEPSTETAFVWACENENVDVVSLRCCSERSFVVARKPVLKALERGAAFELCYAPAIETPKTTRYLAATAARLGDATRCKGLILSSGANQSRLVRPLDQVDNLAKVFFDNKNWVSCASHLLARIMARRRNKKRKRTGIMNTSAHAPPPPPPRRDDGGGVWITQAQLAQAIQARKERSNNSRRRKRKLREVSPMPVLVVVLVLSALCCWRPVFGANSLGVVYPDAPVIEWSVATNASNRKWTPQPKDCAVFVNASSATAQCSWRLGVQYVGSIAVARVVDKPVIEEKHDVVFGSSRLIIEGDHFREGTRFAFAPPSARDVISVSTKPPDYAVASTSSTWRGGLPGPLRITGVDAGGGMLAVDVVVGNAQIPGPFSSRVFESSTKIYASDKQMTIRGINMTEIDEFFFADSELKLGVNYTMSSNDESLATLRLLRGGWSRRHGGPLRVLAVKNKHNNAIIPVAEKGITVATVLRDPEVRASTSAHFQSDPLSIQGFFGDFHRITFDPPVARCDSIKTNSTTLTCSEFFATKIGRLSVSYVDAGAGPKGIMTQVANIVSDDARVKIFEGHPQMLYRSSSAAEIVCTGSGFLAARKAFGDLFFEFDPPVNTTILGLSENNVTLRIDSEPGVVGSLSLVSVSGSPPQSKRLMAQRTTAVATVRENPQFTPVTIFETLSPKRVDILVDGLASSETILSATFEPPSFSAAFSRDDDDGNLALISARSSSSSWGKRGDVTLASLVTSSRGIVRFRPPQLIARVRPDDKAPACSVETCGEKYDDECVCRGSRRSSSLPSTQLAALAILAVTFFLVVKMAQAERKRRSEQYGREAVSEIRQSSAWRPTWRRRRRATTTNVQRRVSYKAVKLHDDNDQRHDL